LLLVADKIGTHSCGPKVSSTLFGTSLLIAAGSALAHGENIPAEGAGYLKSGDNVITTGLDGCLRSGTWSADTQINACEGIEDEVTEEEPKEEVVEAAPEPEVKPNPAKLETATLTENTKFESGSAELTAEGRQSMESLFGKLAAYKNIATITVTGHTDSQGGEAVNQALSEQRAGTVADLLAARYPDASINVVGMGESSPIETNDTPEGRQANRRVDVTILATRMVFN